MIGGILSGVLPFLREQAESMMVDACVIRRGPGSPVINEDTGAVTDGVGAVVYTGKCRVQSRSSVSASPDAGGHSFVVVSREVHIPANAVDVEDDDVVEITASLLNSFTVGKKYRVEGFTPDSFDTASRLPVKEMTS
jgi:hypothetical protein